MIEITVLVPKTKKPIVLTADDVYALVARTRIDGRRMTLRDLASRIGKSRENLTRFLNGHVEFPQLRKALAEELGRMLAELPERYVRAFSRAA